MKNIEIKVFIALILKYNGRRGRIENNAHRFAAFVRSFVLNF
jgi:hypothetical protein